MKLKARRTYVQSVKKPWSLDHRLLTVSPGPPASSESKMIRFCTHLPPTILIQVILLDDLDSVARLEWYLVRVLGDEVVYRVDVFRHGDVL